MRHGVAHHLPAHLQHPVRQVDCAPVLHCFGHAGKVLCGDGADGHGAQGGENVALQAPDGVVGMPRAFAVSPVLPPQPGHGLEGVGLVDGVGHLGFTPELAGVGACFQHLAGVVACLPRLRQRNLGVDTQGQALFLAPMAVFPAPVFARLGGLQVEALFVGKAQPWLVWWAYGLLARGVGQGHFGGIF